MGSELSFQPLKSPTIDTVVAEGAVPPVGGGGGGGGALNITVESHGPAAAPGHLDQHDVEAGRKNLTCLALLQAQIWAARGQSERALALLQSMEQTPERYLLEGEQLPWYPSARLWRQARLGEWEPLLARLAQAIGLFRS